MIKLRQLDLQLAFMGPRPLGEDIQDQARAVDYAALQLALQITLLAGRKHMVEYHQIALVLDNQRLQLGHLAAAYQKARAWLVSVDGQKGSNFRTGRIGQLDEFLGILSGALIHSFEMNEYRPLTPFVALKEQSSLRTDQVFSSSASSPPPCTGRRTGRPGTTVEMACL